MLGNLIKAAGHQQLRKGIQVMTLLRRPCANPDPPGSVTPENAAAAHVRPALLDPELLRQPPLANLVPARD